MAIVNNDIVRPHLGWNQTEAVAKTDNKTPPEASTLDTVKEKLMKFMTNWLKSSPTTPKIKLKVQVAAEVEASN